MIKLGLAVVFCLVNPVVVLSTPPASCRSTWPQAYSVVLDKNAAKLILRTPYYTVEHDLKRGGTICRIALTYGKGDNLLVRPIATEVRNEAGMIATDVRDASPQVAFRRDGQNVIVTVESSLLGPDKHDLGIRLRTTLAYRWGYIKIKKQVLFPNTGMRVKELCVAATVLASSLSDYGYRKGTTETEGAAPFSFGRDCWGQLHTSSDASLKTRYIPRSLILVDPGREGLEWFVGSDLWQWDLQLTGRRGQGLCQLERTASPDGIRLRISPFCNSEQATVLPQSCIFDYYLAVPLREGKAHGPWLHRSFNRNRGDWVSTEQIRQWADQGIQTVHCHNDGDYYNDGLYWRDGSYPPYPDMDRYDQVLKECRRVGIRTATYFSNKELHPSTKEFQQFGEVWGRKDRKGTLRHNCYRRPDREFGAQMCLRSGWLKFLEFSIDRVLKNHPLDGVYYDWNVALLCYNPRHEKKRPGKTEAYGHWDIDELLELMEWTRKRVGPNGLVIIHNTAVPMFATENFADYVVASEWGYGKWTDHVPDLNNLPLEWSLAGARPRGVISYGVLGAKAPRHLHRLFALEAFLNGATPWPASPETFELLPLLKPVGDFESYRFADWRNQAVSLSDAHCAAAIYSREAKTYVLLANLNQVAAKVNCKVHPEAFPCPLHHPTTALVVASTTARGSSTNREQTKTKRLAVDKLCGEGTVIELPAAGAVLIQVGK